MKILSFGEILWDVYPDESYIGGAPLNFAAHLKKHGEEVYMLSALGEDSLGERARHVLEEWGINVEYVSVLKDKETGKCLVTLDENSLPSYNLLYDVAYDFIDSGVVTENFDVLYFGTLALRSVGNLNSIKALLEKGVFGEVFVDVNIRPPFYSKESVELAINNATILKVSLEELYEVASLLDMKESEDYKAFAKELKKKNPRLKCIIITLGADGAYALEHGEYYCPAEKACVVSTVGAGDSFSASFLHKYLKGNNVKDCLKYASRVAGFVVSHSAAVPDYNVEDFN
ncbi:MAG: carbohydrate kinase [Clostridia bacterium]|nr:carbohydrate kinase [Clostridia bacterium]